MIDDCLLLIEYTEFMKMGQPKLSERKSKGSGMFVPPRKNCDTPSKSPEDLPIEIENNDSSQWWL